MPTGLPSQTEVKVEERSAPGRDGRKVVLVFVALILLTVVGMILLRFGAGGGEHGRHQAVGSDKQAGVVSARPTPASHVQ